MYIFIKMYDACLVGAVHGELTRSKEYASSLTLSRSD